MFIFIVGNFMMLSADLKVPLVSTVSDIVQHHYCTNKCFKNSSTKACTQHFIGEHKPKGQLTVYISAVDESSKGGGKGRGRKDG